MFLANASTKRPIAISCLLIALIALGLNSYRKLSIENIPAVDIPVVTVITTWVGASPADIEKDVTKYIEDAVSGIDGLKHIDSSSLENASIVALEFDLAINVDIAAQDVREKIDVILSDLPEDAERPVIQKVNINASPVANIFLSGTAPIDDLYDVADNTLADRFATVPGVAEVQVIGGNEREVWVELDRDRLVAAGLTTTDVTAALQGGVLSLPGGRIREQGHEYSLRFDADYPEVAEIAALTVASREGVRLTLGDLGTVRMATEEIRQRSFLDGRQGIVIKIIKKSEGNIVTVAEEAYRRFVEVQAGLPGGMELTWVSDESQNIQESVHSAVTSVMGAILLCAFILFAFLVNVRTTIIVAITMPVTICISLFFIQLAGQTLNTVTLLAIGLSTGVLVSNSIVVLENIVSKFETMDNHWEAAGLGASEVTVAVLASAGTNVIVMFPIAMMTSMVGRILAPFAITTLIVNAASIFISFTLTPILCALLMEPASKRKHNALTRFGQRWDTGFQHLAVRYSNFLRRIARSRFLSIVIVLGIAFLFFFTMKVGGGKLGFSFFENADYGRILIRIETPAYYDLEKTSGRLEDIQARLMELSDLDHVLSVIGKAEAQSGQASEGVYLGQIELYFAPKTERDWTIFDRLPKVREMLKDETDCMISVALPSFVGGGQSFQIEQVLSGDDLQKLEESALAIQAAGLAVPGVELFDTSVRDTKPEILILPKRTVLSDLGIPASALGMMIRGNVEGIKAASFKSGARTYDIRVKLAEIPGKDQIREFLLPGTDGHPVTLETVADVVDSRSMLQIYRRDKQRSVKFLGDIAPGASMSSIDNQLESAIEENHLIPIGYTLSPAGRSEMMGDALADFGEAILLAAFLTLLVLSAILESWSRPGLVLLTLPMGLIGVIWALVFSGSVITVLVLLGVLMLIGVVVNSAILIVDQTANHLKEGMCKREAMFVAMVDQFRPVLMVVLASGLGMLPIALSSGIGSENRAGIGIASVGGILVAGFLTLVVIPLVYTIFTGIPKEAHPIEIEPSEDS